MAGDGGSAARDSAYAEHSLGCVDEREDIFGGLDARFEDLGPEIGGDVNYGGVGVGGVGEE